MACVLICLIQNPDREITFNAVNGMKTDSKPKFYNQAITVKQNGSNETD